MNTQLASQLSSIRRPNVVGLVVAVLLAATVLALVVPTLETPAHVDRITVDNPHAWWANVDVTGDGRDGWVGIGAVDGETELTFHEVIDQGDAWTFDFAYGGEHVEIRVTRQQLEQDEWRIRVPDRFADQLRSAEVPESSR
jgi:hypothetical protein